MESNELISLVQKSKDGDMEAMEQLLRYAHTSVSYQCRKMLQHPQDAEDLTQEVLVTVFQKLETLKEPAAFNKWLHRITAGKCINAITRSHGELQFAEDEEGHSVLDALEETDEQKVPEKWLDNRETARMIDEIVNGLPEAQRMCTLMFYYSELSVKEMSEVMKVSENTVKSRLNYARKAIREKVLAYEKQGIKLYGLSPLPFLYYFLHLCKDDGEDGVAAQLMVDKILAQGTLAAAGAVGAVGSAGGAAAAGSDGLFALLGLTPVKMIAGLAAAMLIGGLATSIGNPAPTAYEPTAPAQVLPAQETHPEEDPLETEPSVTEDTESTAPTKGDEDSPSSEEDPNAHIHDYAAYYTVAPCCAAEGYTQYTCSVCNSWYRDDFVPRTAHNFKKTVVEPTLYSQGYTKYECTNQCAHMHSNGSLSCLYTYYTDYVPKLSPDQNDTGCAHSFTTTTREATCYQDGLRTSVCGSCGFSYSEPIPKYASHSWQMSTTFPADCLYEGYTVYYCDHCGDEQRRNVVPALGHHYTSRVVAPTETAMGYTLFTCGRCGISFKDNYVDATGASHTHSYTTTVTPPTCGEMGVIQYTCQCGHIRFEEISPLPHTITTTVVVPTQSSPGYTRYLCSVCGYNYTDNYTDPLPESGSPAHTHSYTATVVPPTETVQGYTEHICSGCGDTYRDNYTNISDDSLS